MDYDRNDALLHWIFRQTQGDAWFRPNEENISSGVALRVSDHGLFILYLPSSLNTSTITQALLRNSAFFLTKTRVLSLSRPLSPP